MFVSVCVFHMPTEQKEFTALGATNFLETPSLSAVGVISQMPGTLPRPKFPALYFALQSLRQRKPILWALPSKNYGIC